MERAEVDSSWVSKKQYVNSWPGNVYKPKLGGSKLFDSSAIERDLDAYVQPMNFLRHTVESSRIKQRIQSSIRVPLC